MCDKNGNYIGFIILRHVNDVKIDKYWNHCYDCVRKFYPENPILIIDDNSNQKYITVRSLYKTTIINSEYPKRGELLPYYYYLQNKLFDTAVIIHDSVFINQFIDFAVDDYKMLWEFQHDWDQIVNETEIINLWGDEELLRFYQNKKLWKGCFGGMSVITHKCLVSVNEKYNISVLLDVINTRNNRMSFERVLGVLLQKHIKRASLLGDIHNYCEWGILFNNKQESNHLPIIKVWTGR